MHLFSFFNPRLVIVAASCLGLGSAFAQTTGNFQGFFYSSNGSSVTITSYQGTATSLVIPATIDGLPVTALDGAGNRAPGSSTVTSVSIPTSVTSITNGIFSFFNRLQTVTLPDSVTTLGPNAFTNCTALTSATLSDGLKTISNSFMYCSSLTTVDLPAGLTTLEGTFSGCTSLASIQLPDSVTAILPDSTRYMTSIFLTGAFNGCTSLQNINFPAGLTTIGDYSFRNCSSLTALNFPPALTTIGIEAFLGCTGLTGVTVPETVTTIGDGAFWNCQNLAAFDIPDRFLASISTLGFDSNPQLATDALVAGLANKLANNPDFVTKLANEIISKTGHYGLSTQGDLETVVSRIPRTVREVIAQVATEQPPAHAITSDLGTFNVQWGTTFQYQITTNFGANAFSATGLPDGVTINPATGVITGKPRESGDYLIFLNAGVEGGGTVSGVKKIIVRPPVHVAHRRPQS